MDQKTFTIVFIIVTILAVLGLGYSQLFQSTSEPSPSPIISKENNEAQASGQQPTSAQNIKQYPKYPGDLTPQDLQNKKAVIQTSKGIIEFEIYPEATKAASNFIFLVNDKFYDGLTFHRVADNPPVIQGGDPLGNGTGGPGYKFEDDPVSKPYTKGIVAMANSGPDTNGSQFFIMTDDAPLPPAYSIFGNVTRGLSVVDKIKVGDIIQQVRIENLE